MTRYALLLTIFYAAMQPAAADVSVPLLDAMPEVATPGHVDSNYNPSDISDGQGQIQPSRAGSMLGNKFTSGLAAVRGAKEAKLYKKVSPSVVLVITNEGLGSGSIIDNKGTILTNWHVVAGYDEVGVIFKPKVEGEAVSADQVHIAKVSKIDEGSDLALLQLKDVATLPPPMALGKASDIEVGSDVNAIGHPTGEAWTFTKGIVSQIRAGYKWTTEDKITHQADVIQTQTPINPGNSGGPLFSEAGALVGVNAFTAEGEGLNFAVSISEIVRFMAEKTAKPQPAAKTAEACDPNKEVAEGRNSKNNADIVTYDLDCDGFAETRVIFPDSKQDPIIIARDRNRDEKPDMMIIDENQDQKWDFSLYDEDYDGKYDLEGVHPDGKIDPSKYIPYTPS